MAKKPEVADSPATAVAAVPVAGGRLGQVFRTVVDRMQGARLCYGDPVTAEGRTVIPVARVSARGGLGFGSGSGTGEGEGGGGGGKLNATPVGFIEVTADGTRFVAIDDGASTERMVGSAARAAGTLALLLAVARRVRRG